MIDAVVSAQDRAVVSNTSADKQAEFEAAQQSAAVQSSQTQTQTVAAQASQATTSAEAAPPPNGDPMIPQDAGAQLKAAREAAGLTKEKMAADLGITVNQLYSYENSGVPPKAEVWASFIEKCAAGAYKISVDAPQGGEAGRQMKLAREATGLTQVQMAADLDITLSQFLGYEQYGYTPSREVWAKFVLKCNAGAYTLGVVVPEPVEAGRQLRAARDFAGLTQEQMAAELGTTVDVISKSENMRAPLPREVWAAFVNKLAAGTYAVGVFVPGDGEAGRQLKAAREFSGLTIEQMAAELGVSDSILNSYMNLGRAPSREAWGIFIEKCHAGVFKIGAAAPKNGEAGRQMKLAREAAGLTMEQMASELGITKVSLNHYENSGSTPPNDVWARFIEKSAAGIFNTSVVVPADGEALRQMKAVLDASGLSQVQMAAELGLSVHVFHNIVQGRKDIAPELWARFVEKCNSGAFKFAVVVPEGGEAGRQIRAARLAANMTQDAMSKLLGVPETTLNNIENYGQKPTFQVWASFIRNCLSGSYKIAVTAPEGSDGGLRIKAAREATGLTMEQMAQELGTTTAKINNYENQGYGVDPVVWARFIEKCHAGDFKIVISIPKDGEAARQMKAVREAAGLTMVQMAQEVGMTDSAYERCEKRGYVPPREAWVRFLDKCAAGTFKVAVVVPTGGEAGRLMKQAQEAAGLTAVQMVQELGTNTGNLKNYIVNGTTPPREVWAKFNELYFAGRYTPVGKARAAENDNSAKAAEPSKPAVVIGKQANEILADIRNAQGAFETAVYGGTPEENQAQRTQLRDEMNKQFADIWARVDAGEVVLNDAEREALRQAELEFVFSKIYNPAAKNLIPGYGAALNAFVGDLRDASQIVDPIARGRQMDAVISSFTKKLNGLESTTDEATRRADANERKDAPKAEPTDAEKGPVEARFPERMSPAEAIGQLQDIMAKMPGNGEHAPKLEAMIERMRVVEGKLDALQSRVPPRAPDAPVPAAPDAPAPLPVLSKEQQAARVEEALFKLDNFRGMSEVEKTNFRQLIIDLYTKGGARISITSKGNKLEKVEISTQDKVATDALLQSAVGQGQSKAYVDVINLMGAHVTVVLPKSALSIDASAPKPDHVLERKKREMLALIEGFDEDARAAEVAAEKAANAGNDTEFEKQLADQERFNNKAQDLRGQLERGDFSALDDNPVEMRLRPNGNSADLFNFTKPIEGEDLALTKFPDVWPTKAVEVERVASTPEGIFSDARTVDINAVQKPTFRQVLSKHVNGFAQMSEVEQKAIAQQVFEANKSVGIPPEFIMGHLDNQVSLSLEQPISRGRLVLPRHSIASAVPPLPKTRIQFEPVASVTIFPGVDTDGSEAFERALAADGIDAEVKMVEGKVKIYPKDEGSAQAFKEKFGGTFTEGALDVEGQPGQQQVTFEVDVEDVQSVVQTQQESEQKVVEQFVEDLNQISTEAEQTVAEIEEKKTEWLAEYEANKDLPKTDVSIVEVVAGGSQPQGSGDLFELTQVNLRQDALTPPNLAFPGTESGATEGNTAPTAESRPAETERLNTKAGKANLAQVIDGEVSRKGLYATLLDDTAAWVSFSMDANNPLNSADERAKAGEVAAYYKQKVVMLGGMTIGMKLVEKVGEKLAQAMVPGAAVGTKVVTMGAEVGMVVANYLEGKASWTQVWTTTVASGAELGVTVVASGFGLPGGAAGELARVGVVELMKGLGVPDNQAPGYGILAELIKASTQGNLGAQKVISSLLGEDQTQRIEDNYKRIKGQK